MTTSDSETALDEKIAGAYELLNRAIELYKPSAVFGLFSGGYDSLAAVHVAAQLPQFTAAVHIDTGTAIFDEKRRNLSEQYVRTVCEREGWRLLVYRAREHTKPDGTPDPQNYEDLVLAQGFPGPFLHSKMYNRLKERALDRLVREHKQHARDRILLVGGIRRQESKRRINRTDMERIGSQCWVSPLIDWSKCNVLDYRDRFSLPHNPIVDLIHRSGECNCGAYAQKGELEELEIWYPHFAAYLRELEAQVKAAGFPWGWEEAPPEWWGKVPDMSPERWASMTRREQLRMLEGQSNLMDTLGFGGHLCSSCDWRFAPRTEKAA